MLHCHNFENEVLVVPQLFLTPFSTAPTGKEDTVVRENTSL